MACAEQALRHSRPHLPQADDRNVHREAPIYVGFGAAALTECTRRVAEKSKSGMKNLEQKLASRT
jgi:hypothetical protein